jgi:hypothetical protein
VKLFHNFDRFQIEATSRIESKVTIEREHKINMNENVKVDEILDEVRRPTTIEKVMQMPIEGRSMDSAVNHNRLVRERERERERENESERAGRQLDRFVVCILDVD